MEIDFSEGIHHKNLCRVAVVFFNGIPHPYLLGDCHSAVLSVVERGSDLTPRQGLSNQKNQSKIGSDPVNNLAGRLAGRFRDGFWDG